MKLLQTLLLVLMLSSFGFAYAEDEPKEYGAIEEIEVEPYESIDGKWEVEVEFEDDDITFYVYDIESTDDLPEAIASYLQDELGLDVSESDVSDIIEIDADERDEDEEEEDEEVSKELEIEAEPYESIDGKWEVEIEFDGEEYEFFLTDVDSVDDLPVMIAEYAQENLDLDIVASEVEMVLEVDEEDERDEDEEDEGEEKEEKVDKEKKDKPEQLSQSDRDTLLRLLLLLLIQTIMERDGSVGSEIQKLFDEFR